MPSTEDLQKMYSTAKSVLHAQLAEELSRSVGSAFMSADPRLCDGSLSAVEYFQGRYVSDLANKGRAKVLRSLRDADVGPFSFDFQRDFWLGIMEYVNPGRLLVELDVPPDSINPIKIVEKDGFVDILFDFSETVSAYRSSAL